MNLWFQLRKRGNRQVSKKKKKKRNLDPILIVERSTLAIMKESISRKPNWNGFTLRFFFFFYIFKKRHFCSSRVACLFFLLGIEPQPFYLQFVCTVIGLFPFFFFFFLFLSSIIFFLLFIFLKKTVSHFTLCDLQLYSLSHSNQRQRRFGFAN
jgi:hypothetical protein